MSHGPNSKAIELSVIKLIVYNNVADINLKVSFCVIWLLLLSHKYVSILQLAANYALCNVCTFWINLYYLLYVNSLKA